MRLIAPSYDADAITPDERKIKGLGRQGRWRYSSMQMITSPAKIEPRSDSRWRFLSDVLAFQLKMLLSSLRDFVLIPVSLVAAVIDLIFKGEREGSLFYNVLRWARHSEELIDVYSPVKGETMNLHPAYTVDSVIARIEGAVVREYQKGATAANMKDAVDRVINQVHRDTREKSERARNILSRAAQELRRKK